MQKLAIILVSFILGCYGLQAQEIDYKSLTKNLLIEKQKEWSLEDGDFAQYKVTDVFKSKHNGVTHIYIKQHYKGIPVFNAITNFNIKDGKLVIATNNFIPKIKSKINSSNPKITHKEALGILLSDRGIKYERLPGLKKSTGNSAYVFNQTAFTKSEIPVKLSYYQDRSGNLNLVWNVELQLSTSADYWNSMVDATTGKVIRNYNQTLYCKFSKDAFGRSTACSDQTHNHKISTIKQSEYSAADGAIYRVFPLPIESPIHGQQSIVESPAFEFASEFGWHDTNGEMGPEYTITRGNNVHAYEDSMDEDKSQNNEPDGGENLVFDFPLDLSREPDSLMESAITNLFYTSNYVHDWSYYYGFDEPAGNFQLNNFGKGGRDNDLVQANGLDGEDVGNANFSLTRDGSNGFLQMYKWNGGAGTSFLNIDAPAKIMGTLETGDCVFCPAIGSVATTGKVVVTEDFAGNRGDGCEEVLNAPDVLGNVALMDRGSCNFVDKVFNAQEAGAIAVIICNYENSLSGMSAPPTENRDFDIPGLFLERRDCDAIRASIIEGDDVILTFQSNTPTADGPNQLAGSYDNGIIAHEYGHGISSRLTGGPNSLCLFNDEQMGEGWSDFVGLVLTHEPGDSGGDIRGIGNYVQTGDANGRGIRRKPYSTDFAINNHTYNGIRSDRLVPHNLGEVWATMLWDLYWAFIDEYGFNTDWTDKESGNYKAVQLVFDGMKLQGCSPGFVRGRNGILAADELLFNGEHQCMIWEVFAKRGLGFFADEGSSDNRNDNIENFDPIPTCIKEVKITKKMTDVIDAGNDIEVEITVVNHKEEQVTGTTVIDTIPEGASYKENSANTEVRLSGNALIFDLGTMASLDEREIKYELETSIDKSISLIVDDFESGTSALTGFPIKNGLVEWRITDVESFRGESSYFIPNDTTELDQGLVSIQAFRITGERPTLSFRHMYDTEFFFDGGMVEVSTDGGLSFTYLPRELFLKGGYDTQVDYFTFATPDIYAFTGDSDGWMESYIDLSSYKGRDVLIRFRFGCDDAPLVPDPDNDTARTNALPKPNTGWYIDNFEIVDLSYIGDVQATVTTNEGDLDKAGDITIINTEFTTPTDEVVLASELVVFPNPTQNKVYVNFKSDKVGVGRLQLLDLNGRLISSKQISVRSLNTENMELKQIPAGMYLLQVVTDDYTLSEKIVIEH